ncbi:flavodoxin domain-containing protein [Methyloraptor flagellatus]|uniref:Flavodoxin domain-containing protein n=1 Tax=Methyloraptor flagellatus TaxID=3162530 RepID=A0AAU7X884_9HYPH
MPVGALAALAAIDSTDLRSLSFPAKGDPTDTFAVVTTAGELRVDPATGATLAFAPATTLDRIGAIVRLLHTGRGAWALGLVLGLSSAAVPIFAATGAVLWWRRRAASPRIEANRPARLADTVILVGSEGGSTWGFAATLHAALTRAGHAVHTGAMNAVSAAHVATAERLIVLTATYGEGDAPASARQFLDRLDRLDRRVPVAVLGFGDRSFPQFCRYAQQVVGAFEARGFPLLMPLKRVDRQSAQEFAQWGRDLGAVLGHDLPLAHVAAKVPTQPLELVGREDYGAAVGAPIAILRFRAPADTRGRQGRLPSFEAGDLVGIVPPGDAMPRFYSLASSARDGVLEICVRKRDGGLCSTLLHGLEPGGRVDAFIRPNPSFRPAQGRAPLILIGAGAGIGPLAGFVRANAMRRPVHLYWGGRSPASDFLYEHELAQYLAEKRLTSLTTAFSREADGAYVQDRLAADAARLRDLIRHGAQVLVCGGRDMGEAVREALDAVVHPLGLDLATLKSTGRYVEDIY